MTHLKNPSENSNKPNQSTENQNEQEKNSQEVELPTPEKKNDDITTSNSGKADKGNERAGRLNTDVNDEETGQKKTTQAGFDVNNTKNEQTRNEQTRNEQTMNEQRKDKRGNETEKLERDKTTDPKTKDADWQQDKMNEANNQQGSKVSTDKQTGHDKEKHEKEGSLKDTGFKDTRNDSILDRPKTETYEKNQSEDIGGKINKENYTHSVEEGKRDEQNRKHHKSAKNDSEKRKIEIQNLKKSIH